MHGLIQDEIWRHVREEEEDDTDGCDDNEYNMVDVRELYRYSLRDSVMDA